MKPCRGKVIKQVYYDKGQDNSALASSKENKNQVLGQIKNM